MVEPWRRLGCGRNSWRRVKLRPINGAGFPTWRTRGRKHPSPTSHQSLSCCHQTRTGSPSESTLVGIHPSGTGPDCNIRRTCIRSTDDHDHDQPPTPEIDAFEKFHRVIRMRIDLLRSWPVLKMSDSEHATGDKCCPRALRPVHAAHGRSYGGSSSCCCRIRSHSGRTSHRLAPPDPPRRWFGNADHFRQAIGPGSCVRITYRSWGWKRTWNLLRSRT